MNSQVTIRKIPRLRCEKMIYVAIVFCMQLLYSCNTEQTVNEYAADTASVAHGQRLFGKHCSSCHNFYQDNIGPELSAVTSKQSAKWIRSFIQNPDSVIRSGDTTAKKLFNEYKVAMPSFNFLSHDDVTAVMAYVHSQQQPEAQKEQADTTNLRNPIPQPIQTSDLAVEVDSFTQIPKSSDEPPYTRITKLDFIPQTHELYVLDLQGKLYQLTKSGPQVFLDMPKVRPAFIREPGMATGFGSFAFHPDFLNNGLLYTTHAETLGSGKADFSYDGIYALQWVLTEWKLAPGQPPANGTSREVLRIDMPTDIHGVQEIAFNKAAKRGDADYGLLYIGIGDGGSASVGKPLVSPQPDRIWGSIIRIDPLGTNSKNGRYGIPANNPFVNSSGSKDVPEIYAYGFRNPHKFSWTKSGKLFVTNIGERSIESVNAIEPGHFYGWPIREGTFWERFYNRSGLTYPLPADDSAYHVTYPVAQFDHDEGTAICGGFEYKGSLVKDLKGKYVFGDIGSGTLFFIYMNEIKPGSQATIHKWSLTKNHQPVTLAQLCGNKRVDMRLGMDADGELYILTKADGKIYKLVNK
jgi:glucose/arabinose dehydrogenase